MIKNERQYKVTKSQIKKLESAREASIGTKGMMPEPVYDAMIAGIDSQIRELLELLAEYETLMTKKQLQAEDIAGVGEMIVAARTARGMTQREFASRLNVKPQQIQRYEATLYQSASLGRLQDILRVLEVEFVAEILLVPRQHNILPMGDIKTATLVPSGASLGPNRLRKTPAAFPTIGYHGHENGAA